MFDTSIVRARAATSPYRATLLTASLAIHSAAVLAAITLSIASTRFPSEAPDQMAVYTPTLFPVAPPPPLGVQRQAPPQQAEPPKPQPQQVVTPPQQQTAPPEIPAETPTVDVPVTGGGETATTDQGTGPIGVPWGDRNGVDVGQEFGTQGGTGTQEIPFTPGSGGVTSARVLSRVQPQFPQSMVRAVRMATVVVHCVIDKEGKIRDPKIVVSSFPPLNQAVLEALYQWTFAPGMRNGRPVDTYFELKVNFQVR